MARAPVAAPGRPGRRYTRRAMRGLVLLAVAGLLAAAPAAQAAPDPLRPQQWGLDMIEADPAHQVATGSGAVVASRLPR